MLDESMFGWLRVEIEAVIHVIIIIIIFIPFRLFFVWLFIFIIIGYLFKLRIIIIQVIIFFLVFIFWILCLLLLVFLDFGLCLLVRILLRLFLQVLSYDLVGCHLFCCSVLDEVTELHGTCALLFKGLKVVTCQPIVLQVLFVISIIIDLLLKLLLLDLGWAALELILWLGFGEGLFFRSLRCCDWNMDVGNASDPFILSEGLVACLEQLFKHLLTFTLWSISAILAQVQAALVIQIKLILIVLIRGSPLMSWLSLDLIQNWLGLLILFL